MSAPALIELAQVERTFRLGDSEVHALQGLTCASMRANTSRSWARAARASRRC